jgi:hypothetical protein
MSNPLSAAVDALEETLRDQLEEVAGTKKLINSLLRRMNEPARYEDVSVANSGGMRADEYYGKTVTGAAQMFLERRRTALTTDDIAKGIEQGGFDFKPLNWTEAARVRNIAISLSKNPKMFHRLPNGTWGLTEWYPGVLATAKTKQTTATISEVATPEASNTEVS